MKNNNNMKQLKELVNNSIADLVRLHVDGVQAYNISNNEYEVIMKFEKIRGRYYFIDRDNNKYLASSYDRAEFVAGEFLERVAEEATTVKAAADSIAEKGEATINFDLFVSYIYECEARGINHGELVDRTEDEAGTMYNVYRIESAQDDAQSEATAADEQQGENEETATTCEPFALSGILAKAETAAAKVKAFFAILAKMEWYSFILFGPSLVMLAVVVNCVYMLISGACPDLGRAVEGIVLFGLLAFIFAFGGFVMAGDEWDDAKKEVLIKTT